MCRQRVQKCVFLPYRKITPHKSFRNPVVCGKNGYLIPSSVGGCSCQLLTMGRRVLPPVRFIHSLACNVFGCNHLSQFLFPLVEPFSSSLRSCVCCTVDDVSRHGLLSTFFLSSSNSTVGIEIYRRPVFPRP